MAGRVQDLVPLLGDELHTYRSALAVYVKDKNALAALMLAYGDMCVSDYLKKKPFQVVQGMTSALAQDSEATGRSAHRLQRPGESAQIALKAATALYGCRVPQNLSLEDMLRILYFDKGFYPLLSGRLNEVVMPLQSLSCGEHWVVPLRRSYAPPESRLWEPNIQVPKTLGFVNAVLSGEDPPIASINDKTVDPITLPEALYLD